MLKFFRKKIFAKIVFWFLVILILPGFVLWGTGNLGRGGAKGPSYVGITHDKKISFEDLANSIVGIRVQVIMNYFNQPKVLDKLLNNKQLVAELAWNRLIMLTEAQAAKMRVLDSEVATFIRSHPIFARNGAFDERAYAYILQYNIGLEPRAFEEFVRQNLQIQRLKEMLTKDVTVTDEEVRQEYQREHEKVKLSYVAFNAAEQLPTITIDDTTVAAYYKEHADDFLIPAKDPKTETPQPAPLETVADTIRKRLAADAAREKAVVLAQEMREAIVKRMAANHENFTVAALVLGLKTADTPMIGMTDYIDGIGEAAPLVDRAFTLKPDEVSAPVATRGGAVIFVVSQSQPIDETKFTSDKAAFTARARERKVLAFMDLWLRELLKRARLAIDLKEYEKYYR